MNQSEGLIASSLLIIMTSQTSHRDLVMHQVPNRKSSQETLLELKAQWSQLIHQKDSMIAITFTIAALLGFDYTFSRVTVYVVIYRAFQTAGFLSAFTCLNVAKTPFVLSKVLAIFFIGQILSDPVAHYSFQSFTWIVLTTLTFLILINVTADRFGVG